MVQLSAALVPQPKPWKKSDGLYLSALMGIAFIIRLAFFLTAHHEVWFTAPVVDSYDYHVWAQQIVQGDFLGKTVYAHSPFYPFLLALIYLLTGSSVTWAAGLQLLVMGPVACGLLYLLGRQLFNRPVGIAAAMMEAVYGMSIFFAGNLLNTTIIHLLNLGLLLSAYWALTSKRTWRWWLTGILFGLSVINRPNILPLWFFIGLWLVLFYHSAKQPKAAVKPMVIIGICIMLFVLPLTIRNAVVLKEFMPTVGHSGVMFYLGNKSDATGYHIPQGELGLSSSHQLTAFKRQAEQQSKKSLTYGQSSRYWARQTWKLIAQQPERWQALLAKKFSNFFNHYEYATSLSYYFVREQSSFFKWPWLGFGVVGPLAVLGMILLWRQWRLLLPLYGMVMTYLFSSLWLLVSAEYRYAIMPAIFIFAAAAIIILGERIKERAWSSLVLPVVIVLLFGLMMNLTFIRRSDHNYHLATTYANLAAVYYNQEAYQVAADYYDRAVNRVSKKANQSWLLNLQAESNWKAKKTQAALTAIERAYRLTPTDKKLLANYANILTDMGKINEAVVMRKKYITRHPNDPIGYYNLGITFLWKQQEEAADQAFRKAVRLGLASNLAYGIKELKRKIAQDLKSEE